MTRLRGAEELRVKESDRLQAMADGMAILGIEHTLLDDGIDITGNGDAHKASYGGGRIDSLGDHRIAMAFAISSLRASAEIEIDDCANVSTSFPDFVELATRIGMGVNVEGAHE